MEERFLCTIPNFKETLRGMFVLYSVSVAHDANLATEISAMGIVSAAYDDDRLLFIVLSEFLNFTIYIFRTFGIMHAQKFGIICR